MKRILAVLITSTILGAVGMAAESSPTLSKGELKRLLATASTPADHNRLAQYYRLKAERLDAEAQDHIAMAEASRLHGGSASPKWPAGTFNPKHCEDLAKNLQKSAQVARGLSAEHAEMAKK